MSSLKYNTKEIKFLRNLKSIFKEEGSISFNKFNGDLSLIAKLMNVECSDYELLIEILNEVYSEQYALRTFQKYFSKTGYDLFDKNRFKKYIDYKKVNVSDSNTNMYFQLVYGDVWEKYKVDFQSNKNNAYDPIYIAKKYNISHEEALVKVNEYKTNKATSLEGFIDRFGEEVGLEKFEKFKQTSKHTKEKYIDKYGKEEGVKKWEEYILKKKNNSVFNTSYWENKGYSKEEAEELRKEFHKNNLSTSSVDYWISKGLSEDESLNKVLDIFDKKKISFGCASKESLEYFKPLYDKFTKLGERVFLGIEGSREFCIYNKEKKRACLYDFCLPDRKLIIEFNGYKYHPNPDKISKEDWVIWKVMDNKITITADEQYAKDQDKLNLAIDNGFKILVIWSDDSKEENWNKINEFI